MPKPSRLPSQDEQRLVEQVRVQLLSKKQLPRGQRELQKHHYLGSIQPVGERLFYVAVDAHGRWCAVLVFHAAAKHLRPRDQWIGWTSRQRQERLGLVVQNARFCLLGKQRCPNLASRVLALCLQRLSADWETAYGHPVLLVETFVDPQRFSGACYRAQGWTELGPTQGWGRSRADYYERHDQPKVLFARELHLQARRSLQAEHLAPRWESGARSLPPPCGIPAPQVGSLVDAFRSVPDYRARVGIYPLWGLLALLAVAFLSGSRRGYRDLERFAQHLTQGMRRRLGFRLQNDGRYPAPGKDTLQRVSERVAFAEVKQAALAWQQQVRGPVPPGSVIVGDGKELRHSQGAQVVTLVAVPSQHVLDATVVEDKSNEIPALQQIAQQAHLEDQLVALDALHTQHNTARDLLQQAGADYLMVVKANQPTLLQTLRRLLPDTPATFSPSREAGPAVGAEPRA